MEQSPTLLGLPVEMFQRIAELTSKEELMCLRLVSRDCAAKVLKVYKEVLFSEQKVMLSTTSSIRNAIEVVDHPVFGGVVQKLVLVDDSLPDPSDIDFTSSTETGREESACARLLTATHRAQNSTWKQGESLRLLTLLLRKYSQGAKNSIIHLETISELEIEDGRELWSGNDVGSLEMVLRAVVASKARFGTLSMDKTVVDGICPVKSGRDDSRSQLCTEALRDNFKELDIVIEAYRCSHMHDVKRARHFYSSISHAQLRSVKIVGGPVPEHQPSAQEPAIAALMDQEFKSLEFLEFGRVGLQWHRLVPFLTRQRNLRELRFSDTWVYDTPETYYDVETACGFLSRACDIAKVTEEATVFD